jgi:FixJ family two-component response regulator
MIQETRTKGEIFVVDNDAATRETLSLILQEDGYDVICFADGPALLSTAKTRIPSCVFLEITIPGKSGLDTLKRLRADHRTVPVFVISGRADIPTAVAAIRSGAIDFIQKPLLGDEIIGLVNDAVGKPGDDTNSGLRAFTFPGCKALTRREQEVLEQIAAGASNKEVARQLGLSTRTIEDYRASVMKKVGVRNAAELMHRIFGPTANS